MHMNGPSSSWPPESPPGPVCAFRPRQHYSWRLGNRTVELGTRTWVMGILNCTPDSFSDGGRHLDPEAAVRRLEQILQEGADCVDVGGESTRPGAEPVPADVEWSRIRPVLEAIRRLGHPALVSVDTTKYEVAIRALDLGAAIVNDVSGLAFDPRLADLAARFGAGLIVMHMQGKPRTMQQHPRYEDVVAEVGESLARSVTAAEERGVHRNQLMVDPGIGFGKTIDHNLELLRRLPALEALSRPILVGASRKGFLGRIVGIAGRTAADGWPADADATTAPLEARLEASLGVHAAAALAGAHMVRVHDVHATVRTLAVIDAVRETRPFEETPRPL